MLSFTLRVLIRSSTDQSSWAAPRSTDRSPPLPLTENSARVPLLLLAKRATDVAFQRRRRIQKMLFQNKTRR